MTMSVDVMQRILIVDSNELLRLIPSDLYLWVDSKTTMIMVACALLGVCDASVCMRFKRCGHDKLLTYVKMQQPHDLVLTSKTWCLPA